MMYVEIRELVNAKDTVTGTITWDGVRLIANPPDDIGLNKLIAEVEGDPNRLALLYMKYRSPYLRVSAPIQVLDAHPAI